MTTMQAIEEVFDVNVPTVCPYHMCDGSGFITKFEIDQKSGQIMDRGDVQLCVCASNIGDHDQE